MAQAMVPAERRGSPAGSGVTLPAFARGGLALFFGVRARVWRVRLHELLRQPAKLTVLLITWAALLGGMYWLSLRGIAFVYETAGVGPFLLSRLWFLFLFIVAVMLGVSQLANAYSTLVRAPESRWWMVLPVSARTLCRAKWIESSVYSAWAVVLFVLPMWLAYLVVLDRPVWRMGWVALALLIPLIGIVTAVSTAILLLWLRWLSGLVIRREFVPVGLVLAGGACFWLLGELESPGQQDVWFLAMQALLPRMQIAMSGWLPSSWVAGGMDAGLNGRWTECLRAAALLWTTMLVAWRLLDHLAAAWLLPVLRQHAQPSDAASLPLRVERPAVGGAGTFATRWWMRAPLRASLVKDLLFVIRDPMQWSQGVVFFSLLGAYFANIHRMAHFSVEPAWRIGVASLNLACTLLVFGSLAVRFVYPQMSLEGRALWIVRMAPGGMRHLLASKLCLYGALAVLIVDGLLAVSVDRLDIPAPIAWWLAGVGVLAALTIVGLTVGLGACWIDPEAQDAARVVSSSHGALVLVSMIAYVSCVVAALIAAWTNWLGGSAQWLVITTLALAAASLAAGLLPIRRGLARLERLGECG